MKNGKIYIPAKRKQNYRESQVVRISAEAYSCLIDIYNDSSWSVSQIVSKIIIESMDSIVLDKEDV